MKKITIAIDGYSSCGKSTMAKDLAREIGYVYVDSGAMYRAVTLYAVSNGLIHDGEIDEARLRNEMKNIHITFRFNLERSRPDTYLNGQCVEDLIRTLEISEHVSPIAALGFVREEMVRQQQLMGREGGIIMDGRDVGTTVFPQAELKIFVTASSEIRAQRRHAELLAKGEACDMADILRNVEKRDYIDTHREISPLRQAEDALVLDNSHMTIAEQKQWLLQAYKRAAED